MVWKPMTREEAKQVLAEWPEPTHLANVISLDQAAHIREAQLVLKGREPDSIYEELTFLLGRPPDAKGDEGRVR